MIAEGQQFEYMGFEISPIARQAIMSKNLLFKDVESVAEMIDKYNHIVLSLSVAEVGMKILVFICSAFLQYLTSTCWNKWIGRGLSCIRISIP